MIPKSDIDELELETIDGRIRLANREIKAKKAFSFVEAGKERNELHFVTCFKSKRVICFVGFKALTSSKKTLYDIKKSAK